MKNFPRTDLASEIFGVKKPRFDGICKISEISLDAVGAAKYGKNEGRYVTVETDVLLTGGADERARLSRALASEIGRLAADFSRVLVVGLGNPAMTADALGAETCERLNVGKGLMCIAPGVSGTTGIESYDIVKGVTEQVRPDLVIAVDSLAAAATVRVGRVFQLCDAGITPGSGVSNHKKRLSKQNLGVPVIGIGVPLVVYASTIIRDAGGDEEGFESLIVTPKDVDVYVTDAAEVIAEAVNTIAARTDASS